MQIMFHGNQSAEEAGDSILSLLRLFKDRYGISDYREMHVDFTMIDEDGHDVELVDAITSEVLGVFEVYKSGELRPTTHAKNDSRHLHLVVDNTKRR